jgi:outer membrane protein assembly factor BamB
VIDSSNNRTVRSAKSPWSAIAWWVTALSLAVSVRSDTLPGEWPQYRGPARDGRSTETGLLAVWPEGGPPEVWRISMGPAFSGISVVADRLYTMDSDAEHESLVRLDAATGDVVWRTAVGKMFEESFGNGPRSTPTVDGERVYVLGSLGDLTAVAAESGEVRWQVAFRDAFGAEVPRRGFSESILVTGDLVVVSPGAGSDRSIAALDKRTGEVRWTLRSDPGGYSSPIVVDFDDRRQIVMLSPTHALGLTLEGSLLWEHEFAPTVGVKPAMPLWVRPDLLVFSASYDVGALALRLTSAGGSTTVQEIWQDRVMRNHFNSSVVVDGYIYGFDNATLRCIEAESGRSVWAKRGGLGKGSLLYADGHLIVLSETGRLLLIEATPDGFVEKSRSQVLQGRSWTAPPLANGRLYVRNLEEMVCLDLRP